MAKNDYAARLKAKKSMEREIITRWAFQMCLDVMTLVLNDPEVMGNDVFGAKRLQQIGEAFNKELDTWMVGLSRDVNASYVRDKMDERLKRIWGETFCPWAERYTWWNDQGI